MSRIPLLAAFLVALPPALLGCVSLDPEARTDIVAPSETDWKPVGLFLVHRCASLDCHGQPGRNLRIYGKEGLRLDPMEVPGAGPTTAAELDADYRSAVALEPEIISQVVKDGGAHPERLTLVRKPRGQEHHKGGTLVQVGDDQDKCLTSWLADAVDDAACASTLALP